MRIEIRGRVIVIKFIIIINSTDFHQINHPHIHFHNILSQHTRAQTGAAAERATNMSGPGTRGAAACDCCWEGGICSSSTGFPLVAVSDASLEYGLAGPRRSMGCEGKPESCRASATTGMLMQLGVVSAWGCCKMASPAATTVQQVYKNDHIFLCLFPQIRSSTL